MTLVLIFITFFTFFISALIRAVVLHVPAPIPNNFLLFVLGMVYGHVESIYPHLDLNVLVHFIPAIGENVVLPVILFEAAYSTNVEAFFSSGKQLLLLVLLTFGSSLVVIGVIVVHFCDYGWSWNHAVILNSIVVVPGPILTVSFLRRMAASSKLQNFLEGEALLGNCLAFIVFRLAFITLLSEKTNNAVYFSSLVIGSVYGLLVGKVITYWVSRIICDSVNQVCIVVASLYMCFLSAEMMHISGLTAVVSMGLYMTDKKPFVSGNTEKILLRFLHVVSMYFNCNLIMFSGMFTARILIPVIAFSDLIHILIIHVTLNIMRISVVLLLCPLLKYTGCCFSSNNITVICLCNIRGAISMFMALCLLHKDFKFHENKKMLAFAIGQVVLSLLVNSVLANLAIRTDVLVSRFESKSHMMANVLRYMNDIRHSVISLFKHENIYLADADWSVVEKYTKLRHPLIDSEKKVKSATQEDTEADHERIAITRILTMMRKVKTSTQEDTEADHERIAITRILTMMRCSYWKQYEEGLVSHKAAKRLMHWCSQALVKGNTLIFPEKIASALKVPRFYQYVKQECSDKYAQWTSLGTRCKPLQIMTGIFVVALYLIDLNMTLLQLVHNTFGLLGYKDVIFVTYNITFITVHGLLFVYRYMLTRHFSLWEKIILLVVLQGTIDVVTIWFLQPSQDYLSYLKLFFIGTKLFRVVRIAEVSPYCLKRLIQFCERHIYQALSEGYDMGRSYIRGRLEVLRLLNFVEQDIPHHIVMKFKNTCRKHKIETTRLLAYLDKEHPYASVSAKTRQASHIILSRELRTLKNLQRSRIMRNSDGAVVEKVIHIKMARLMSNLKIVQPRSHQEIICNVDWIKDNCDVIEIIMNEGIEQKFNKSDVIVDHHCPPGGIFIILDGIAALERHMDENRPMTNVKIADYLSIGNVIGELTFLTGKPGHKTIWCETDLTALFISSETLWSCAGGKPSVLRKPLSKLVEKMWRVVAIRIAYRIMLGEPSWIALSQSEILMKLVDGTLVDGTSDPYSFSYYNQTSNVILIHGTLIDEASGDVLVGPAFIPPGHMQFTYKDAHIIRPILYVLPVDSERDQYFISNDQTSWNLMPVTETSSNLTLSSGSSVTRPVCTYKLPRKVPKSCHLSDTDFHNFTV